MGIAFSSGITYVEAQLRDGQVRLQLEGKTIMSKGLFDYFATPIWYTDWFVYDPYGRLILEDARWHSIVPISSRDEAFDSFSVGVEKHSYYNVLLRGRHGDAIGESDEKQVILGSIPKPVPPPIVPEPEPFPPTPPLPPIPIPPPKPAPLPKPVPTPTPPPEPEPPPAPLGLDWKWVLIGGAVILALTMIPSGEKK